MEDFFDKNLDYDGFENPPPSLPEYNKDEAMPVNSSGVVHVDSNVHASLKALGTQLDSIKNADGSRLHPARTCQDIKQCYPMKKSGEEPTIEKNSQRSEVQ